MVHNRELLKDADALPDFTGTRARASTRDILLELPEGMDYQTGDHLAVYPTNREDLVNRACRRLHVPPSELVLTDNQRCPAHLPPGTTLSVGQLLGQFLELQEPASPRDLRVLAADSSCTQTRDSLTQLAENHERYHQEIHGQRQSVLDLLEHYPAVELPLEVFAALCLPLRPRFYSISSSALAHPNQIRLTVGTRAAPARSGRGEYRGVATSLLKDLDPGDEVLAEIRTPTPPFAPVADPAQPMILIGAGTGLAPFRAFLEERNRQREQGQCVASNQLFTGCRHPDHDRLYAHDMDHWQEQGVVTIHPAYSALADYRQRSVPAPSRIHICRCRRTES